MDPVSVISLIQACAGITLSAGKLAVCLKSLASRYKNIELTIQTLSNQCKLFATAVSAIQRWMCDGPERDVLHEEVWKQLHDSLDCAENVITALETDITPFAMSGLSHSAKLKTKAIWNLQNLKDHDDRIRSQISGLQLILHIMQLPSKPKQRTLIQDEASVFEGSRASVRSLFGDSHSERCSTVATEFDFDAQLFTSGVYKRYVLAARSRDMWIPASSVQGGPSEDEYHGTSIIRTENDTETIRDQAPDAVVRADIGAFRDQSQNANPATNMPNGDMVLHTQPSLESGENLMRSLDYAANKTIEMKIAEPDHTKLEEAQLKNVGPQREAIDADFTKPHHIAKEAVEVYGYEPVKEENQIEAARPDHAAKARIGTKATEPANANFESENLLLPKPLPVTSDQDASDDSDLDVDDAYPCKGCGNILEEGKAFELADNRWHIDCFRCYTCNILLNLDANFSLVSDGSLLCDNCRDNCSGCGYRIEGLVTLAGGQAFCAACFKCRDCKRKIENLRYARTSQGIFCMSCHEALMSRRRKKRAGEKEVREKAQSKTQPTSNGRDQNTTSANVAMFASAREVGQAAHGGGLQPTAFVS